ncbi:MAG: alpha/beta fold hydrolase [Pseudomonadota bacterium]
MKIYRGYEQVSFGQVHYRQCGESEAPVLMLVHQAPSNSAMYESVMQQMAKTARLVAPDIPGAGMSDPVIGPMTIDALASGLAEFLDRMAIHSIRLFGHHMGASVVAQLAASHPDRVAALCLSGPPLLTDELRAALPGMAEPFEYAAGGEHLRQYWARMRDKDPTAPLSIVERETINALQLGNRYRDFYTAVANHDLADVLPHIRCPTVVFAADDDPLQPFVDRTVALLPDARSVAFGPGRTYLCDRNPERVAEVLASIC